MNVINEYRVEVELAPAEMERLGVSFESLDWGNIDTRRAVWSVLDALREDGVSLDLSGKVLIEADRGPGSVRLRFSVLPQRGSPYSAKSLVKSGNALLLRGETEPDALKASRLFKDADVRVYRSGGAYFLLVRGSYTPVQLRAAAEFCEPARPSAVTAAYIEEHLEAVRL